ncbi:MAG: TerB family tellurite resistance protein [Bacteroidia bacterium]|nr:TerB family tellurite resistance protein [Bacteroidia bacterium]
MKTLDLFDHSAKNEMKIFFVHLAEITRCDGKVDENELTLLHKIGQKFGFTDPEIDKLIQLKEKVEYIPPFELAKRFDHIYQIMRIILADGVMDECELKFVKHFAISEGFDEQQTQNLINILSEGIKNRKDEDDLFGEYRNIR